MSIWTDIKSSQSTKVRALCNWWVGHRGASGLPDRSDFDPIEYRNLLPNMLFNEVELDPFRIRYRLVGTKVQNILNINITGRYLDELVDGATKTPWMAYFAPPLPGAKP